MKLVFLDIDGVLNHSMRYAQFDYPRLFPEHCERFQRLCLRTQAEIVIVSNWKGLIAPEALVCHLRAAGISAPVVSITPPAATRGDEVNLWRELYSHRDPYVILDDRSDYYATQPLVQTRDEVGLLDGHVQQAEQILCG